MPQTTKRLVVLCDDEGASQGTQDLLQAHAAGGRLHKAFSVFVFRRKWSELLIQQRSSRKMLFPMLWANTCCSHPSPTDEDITSSAMARLQEECGLTVPLTDVGSFVYRADDAKSGGTEFEHDTVLIGHAPENVPVRPDPNEIANWKWVGVSALQNDLGERPESYAPWLAEGLHVAVRHTSAEG